MSLVEQAIKKVQQAKVKSTETLPSASHLPVDSSGPVVTKPTAAEASRSAAPKRVLVIDRSALMRFGLLPPEEQEGQVAQEYRHIKRPLIERAFGKGARSVENGRVIVVSSAMPGDGKTCTSINLALSIAKEKDVSVLLVDADVAKPHISSLLGAAHDKGLMDVLRDSSAHIEDALLPTDVPGLSFLPAGSRTDHATEQLASARMQEILGRLLALDPNRIVLFDSPPLLITSESRVLTTLAGQVVLVVCAGRTPQKAVFDALNLLGEEKAVGVVLNQSPDQEGGYGYGYYGQGQEVNSTAG